MSNAEPKGNGRTGVVFNVQGMTVHDGPGIRSLVFMKGCPLSCQWCSNPESQRRHPEAGLIVSRCIGVAQCGWCLKVCPVDAIGAAEVEEEQFGGEITRSLKVKIDHERCARRQSQMPCFECANACPAKAVRIWGEHMLVDAVLHEVEKDKSFYDRSGGGLTVGGGEPLAQADFVCNLLQKVKERGLHTVMETCGYAPWEKLESCAQHCDWVYYDIKHMDSQKHREGTGVGNELILENLRKLVNRFPEMSFRIRTPVVPGFNDTEENIKATAEFISGLQIAGLQMYELLPYHGYGEPKYRQLGREYGLTTLERPTHEALAMLKRAALVETLKGAVGGRKYVPVKTKLDQLKV